MMCMRRAVALLVPILAVMASVPALARADGGAPVRIRDVRVGEHSGFERLVIELDNDAEIVWENGPEPGEESFYIAAAPAQPSRVIATKLPHVGTISVTEMKGGTHVAVEPRARRVRAYTLTNPPRLVVDFAAPARGAFEAPAGTRALEPATTLGPLEVEPETAVEPKQVPAVEPKPVAATEPKPVPATEPKTAATAPAPKPSPEIAAEPEPKAASLESPPSPEPVPEPALTPQPSPTLEPAPTTEPTTAPAPAPAVAPKPAAPKPAPVIAKPPAPALDMRSPGTAFPWGLAIAALLGLLLLIAAAVGFTRMRAARSESRFSEFPELDLEDAQVERDAAGISPAEILAAGDHDGMLEKRLDEEVRARLELEQRFAHANEELKVLRDRLHRLERRREGGPS